MITKAQAQAEFEKCTSQELNELSTLIDAAIRKDWYPGARIIISPKNFGKQATKLHLIELYRNAGWTVEFNHDQKDGDWISVE